MKAIITDKRFVIVGLGQTGLSCVRYLSSLGKSLVVMDTREHPPGLDALKQEFPDITLVLGSLDTDFLCQADEIILSPGIALSTPELKQAQDSGVLVRGDIDLFAEAANAPIVAITGSNGKSTVTTLLGEMAKMAGLNVGIGGFQLETTRSLNASSVVLLNLSEDHMDRYVSKLAYLQAKQRIFLGAKNVVVNDDDALSVPLVNTQMHLTHFGLGGSDINKFSVLTIDGERFLARGFEALLNVKELQVRGEHNISNCLAALALGFSIDLPMKAMLEALKCFKGLAHRCAFVRTLDCVDYINDSKGTNPGAVVTALNGLGGEIAGKIVLIAGGDAKGADISSLLGPVQKHAKAMVLIGKDAAKFEQLLKPVVPLYQVKTMADAVRAAQSLAERGDLVLLSPACASFDMFKNFEHRGDVFCEEVMRL